MNDNQQKIAENNAGRSAEALELAGINSDTLKRRIKKLIYFTAQDVAKECECGCNQRESEPDNYAR